MIGRHSITRTTSTTTFAIGIGELLEYLKSKGKLPKGIVGRVEAFVEVPSGGDYSGMELDIGNGHDIKIRYTEEKEEFTPAEDVPKIINS